MSTSLSKTETTILLAAASRSDGLIEIPPGTKPASWTRLLGRFLRDGFAAESEAGSHRLTPAGYKALGLKPPRKVRGSGPAPVGAEQPARSGTKLAHVREMLARNEGATLDELIAATGWLPHTTRAALSRIRKAGQALAKSARPDGRTAYRSEQQVVAEAEVREPSPRRRGRRAATVEMAAPL